VTLPGVGCALFLWDHAAGFVVQDGRANHRARLSLLAHPKRLGPKPVRSASGLFHARNGCCEGFTARGAWPSSAPGGEIQGQSPDRTKRAVTKLIAPGAQGRAIVVETNRNLSAVSDLLNPGRRRPNLVLRQISDLCAITLHMELGRSFGLFFVRPGNSL